MFFKQTNTHMWGGDKKLFTHWAAFPPWYASVTCVKSCSDSAAEITIAGFDCLILQRFREKLGQNLSKLKQIKIS